MRQETITSAKAGINRYRTKGGASKETLYDFLNGYVTVAGSFRPRPGSVIDSLAEGATSLPPGTVGLTTYKDKLVVFADHEVDVSGYAGYAVELLTYPGAHLLEEPPTLVDIHFAEPFLGYLYVAAEWSDGEVFHYWLQRVSTWQPNTVYMFGELVQPTTPDGYTYRAGRLNPANPLWRPDTAYALGFIVEPTEQNGYQYEAVELVGDSPRSGATEPAWIASPGALVNDDADFGVTVPDEAGGDGGDSTPPQEVIDRYGLGPQAPTNREEQ
jgi:hypothetical protein